MPVSNGTINNLYNKKTSTNLETEQKYTSKNKEDECNLRRIRLPYYIYFTISFSFTA
jgi:hypothetical protein